MFVLKSYAKINLFLRVIGRRVDNYHFISSLMSYIDMYDVIHIVPNKTRNPSLIVKGRFEYYFDNLHPNSISSNIIIKTLRHMSKMYHINAGFDITLYKNIPLASGMGGGSSNAATIIRFCNDYFNLGLSNAMMMAEAQIIGADVSFFIGNQCSLCEGIGNIVHRVISNIKDVNVVVINPMLKLSTPKVYSGFNFDQANVANHDIDETLKNIRKKGVISILELVLIMNCYDNDLTKSAIRQIPQIFDILQSLKSLPDMSLPRMSGSGATCFAFCDNDVSAMAAVNKLREDYPLAFVGYFNLLSRIDLEYFSPSSIPCFEREMRDFNVAA